VREVTFAQSAFRHGYVEEDFYEVLAGRYLKIRSQRGIDDLYELLGQNLSGDYLHVVYRVMADGAFRVFHMGRMSENQKKRFRRIRQ
jgi:hypothetical protein